MKSCGVTAEMPFFNPAYEQEKSALVELKNQLEKSNDLTEKVNAILTDFDTHLLKLHSSIRPVFNETENLQICQKNIENSLRYVSYVSDCYKVAEEVEQDIRKGPSSLPEGGCGLDVYLSSFDRLLSTKKYFQNHNPQSLELNNVNSLIDFACDSLNREFKSILFKDNKLTEPADLIRLMKSQSDGRELYGIAPSALLDLSKIANCLLNNNRDEFMTIYGQIRSTSLQRTLQGLKDHQKSARLESSSSGLLNKSCSSSPSMKAKFQTRSEAARKPSTKKAQSAIEKKANRMLLKASQTLESSTNFLLGASSTMRRTSFLDVSGGSSDDLCCEQDIDTYFNTIAVFCKLLRAEQSLLQTVIPSIHQPKVLEIVARDSLDTLVQDAKSITARAKRTVSRHEYLPMLSLFPLWNRLRKLKPDFDKMTEKCDNAVRAKFSSVIDNIYSMSTKVLEEFIDNLRTESSSQLPKDGIVFETTSNALIYLCQLFEHVEIVGEVFRDLYQSAMPDRFKSDASNRAFFGFYSKKVLSQLNVTLINRSEQYNDLSLKALFRLNNNYYILKTLQRNQDLLDSLKTIEPNCEQNYYRIIEEHKKSYLEGWSKLINYIDFNDNMLQLHGGVKLKDKDRSLLKDKFAGFNREMEEMARVQREYAIPDVELRESLKRDNKEHILPKYNAFFENYSSVAFTKNPDKYVKYTPAQISAMIDRFFDVAA